MAEVLQFDHAESRRRRDSSERAKTGRKRIMHWRRTVEEIRQEGALIDFDCRLADALMAYPSSTMSGYVWASQGTIAAKLRKSIRSVARGIGRLKRLGLLEVEQRGKGRSARCTFCIGGEPLVTATAKPSMAGQARTPVSELVGSAMTQMSDESCKQYESFKRESLLPPPTTAGLVEGQQRPTKRPSAQAVDNKIVDLLGNGNIELGWNLYGYLTIPERDLLIERVRVGDEVEFSLIKSLQILASSRIKPAERA